MRYLAALACLLGCRDNAVSYHVVDFPGFSIDVPSALTWSGDAKAAYRNGQANATTSSQLVFIAWQAGTIASVEDMPVVVKAIATVLPEANAAVMRPAHSAMHGGQTATELDAVIHGVDVTFADITCGARSVMIGIGAAHDFPALRARVLDSFQCKASAADDKAIANAAPFGVDDPKVLAGFWRMTNDDAYVITNGASIVMVTSIPSNGAVDAAMLRTIIPPMFKGFGGDWTNGESEDRVVRGAHRMFQKGTMVVDGETLAGVIALWPCLPGESAVLALGLESDAGKLPVAIDRIAKLRCAKPNDPPLALAAQPDGSAATP